MNELIVLPAGQARDTWPPAAAGAWLASWQPAVLWLAGVNSLHTRRAYTTAVRQFARGAEVELGEVVEGHVLAYKALLVSRRLAPRTVRQRLVVLASFFAWAMVRGHHPGPNPAARIPLPRVGKEPVGLALDGAGVEALAGAAGNARDRALVRLLADGGLRASELVALEERDVIIHRSPDGGVLELEVLVRAGKGGRGRTVSLGVDAAAALVQYLGAGPRQPGATRPLFQPLTAGRRQRLDGSGAGISYDTVYRVVRAAAHRAGLGHLAPHDLRRTYATLALDLGVPAPRVSRQMGHRGLEQTVRYYRGGGG